MTLNRRQIIELSYAIEERRRALLEDIHAEVGRTREEPYAQLAGPVRDTGDEAAATAVVDLEQAEITRDLGALRAIEAARDRIAEGTYGVCADCGADIPLERLRIAPAALRCFDCQRVREKTYRN